MRAFLSTKGRSLTAETSGIICGETKRIVVASTGTTQIKLFAMPYWWSMTVFFALSSILAIIAESETYTNAILGLLLSLSMVSYIILGKYFELPTYLQLVFGTLVQLRHLSIVNQYSNDLKSNQK